MNDEQNTSASNLGGDPAENANQQSEQQSEQQNESQKQTPAATPSLDEILKDPKNQSAFDKKVAKALQTAREKWEAEAKLSDEEKASRQMSEREQSLDEREAALNMREFTASIKDKLTQKKLPVAFAEVLAAGSTEETIDETVKAIAQEWSTQITEQIKAGARQKDPLAGGTQTETPARDSLAEFARQNRKVK